ncbi:MULTISPECIES: type III secretion system export apparatus subunit SctR [Pseudomonas]|uniref:EscR/YscR/HrcR family type III secretion system export apparatus protein n=2 Tax=Pseudomonas TaxID=286 RepID=A0AAD0L3V3_PSEPU|nr:MULTISPECIES: type III secretion system export apparatus subunit SctR [Pseudomonas]QXI42325.1 type III secretion system export apparatus subunit SctR [Pseudomonas wayambapalatensis]ANC02333.1 type III secretion system protein SsaR [Pseudomonas putida]AXA23956.1 EscR/YscR/HrcR family type III secretion system export apparatus protein [Pseudomonas putida]KAB5627384.1 EscR/YscR/HrcR family type III secretion system export apparatus protein [Pseudomonas putida]MBC3423541.1 type III secretion sy
MSGYQPNLIEIILVVASIGLIPLAVVTLTGFLKISVVLFLIRNALGVQQTPPNLVLYGIALILSVYVTTPVIGDMYRAAQSHGLQLENAEQLKELGEAIRPPLQAHLSRFANESERGFFVQATQNVWSEEARAELRDDDLVVLIPAFVSSELTRAFEIGFLLYIPFLVVDLLVSNVLMAMGMSMVSPTLISIPLKLFLFVALSGWSRLMHGLILSYGS